MTPSSIDLARVVGWKLSFPIASGYRSLILGKSGVFPTTYASTNPQANQVFMTSNDNPNLAVEPELSTIYLSQIHQTQRNFPRKQWIIQCLVTSCKTQRDTFWPWQLDTPKHLLNLLQYIVSLAWQRSKGWTAVEFPDSTLPYILFNQIAEIWGDCLRCVPQSFFYFLALGWAFKRMYCTASFIG